MEEDSKIVSVGFSYVNLNAFNPNKEFILSIDDLKFSKYCGKYSCNGNCKKRNNYTN